MKKKTFDSLLLSLTETLNELLIKSSTFQSKETEFSDCDLEFRSDSCCEYCNGNCHADCAEGCAGCCVSFNS